MTRSTIPLRTLGWFVATLGGAALCGAVLCGAVTAEEKIDFNREIRPLLSNRCFACHGPDEAERQADLRLDTREGALRDLGGYAALVPGKAEESELLHRISLAPGDEELMPPAGKGTAFTEAEVARIRKWIEQEAPYARHWSYVKPVRPALPEVGDTGWPVNEIDAFVLARLESEGLEPSTEADRHALARRAALDLTGLPPSWEEVVAFVRDPAPDAYERYLDRLLAKPAYGERWTRVWLDLARYADSAGYADDPLRTIWAYRDYVLRAFNENMPFDRFTIEQIAGDLLENPTTAQLVATAFHRNTMTNSEGGTNDEEFRNEAVVDRVNTTMSTWMGTTMACAQCHTHKFDPLTHAEYFQLFAFFNQSEDADRKDEKPVLELWSDPQKKEKREWSEAIRKLEETLATATGPLDDEQAELADLEKRLAEAKPATTVPIMRDLPPDQHRRTFVQLRGNYTSLGPEVSAGVPAIFHPLEKGIPRNRLALAKWLVDPDNPLTPRVVANRYWEEIFGNGIVETSEEFGSQGEPPSHPDLLDWLAVDLQENGWDIKRLLKQIAMSATYRQSSKTTPEMQERDPFNRLFTRGPRFRLSAEQVRDNALAVSGLLSDKMYGPPVHPPQPERGLKAAFGGKTDWADSPGEDRYRRALYTSWRRSHPYPSMATFDAPNREVCTVRRGRTNTPLQALVTLNDPVYVEAAQAFGRRILKNGGTTLSDRLTYAIRESLARDPRPAEVERLATLYETSHADYTAHPEEAARIAEEPLGPVPDRKQLSAYAAWTVVANVILNLDEIFMKR
ncbi:MAG: DUF1553 domain-containing protein [Verrucomicrobiaceae bacterium]|nr:DUF1553 domain-containing protein [Verrucomicrobiaceae bacterium]